MYIYALVGHNKGPPNGFIFFIPPLNGQVAPGINTQLTEAEVRAPARHFNVARPSSQYCNFTKSS